MLAAFLGAGVCAAAIPVTQIVYSTFLGGTHRDVGVGIALDPHGFAYVVGHTESGALGTTGTFQPTKTPIENAFIAKLAPSGKPVKFSYFGGPDGWGNRAKAVAYGPNLSNPLNPHIYFGGTLGSVVPGLGIPAGQFAGPNHYDAFVAQMDLSLVGVTHFALLGGSSTDQVQGIAINPKNGDVYACGWTCSADFMAGFPSVVNIGGTPCKFCNTCGANDGDAFIVRLDANLVPHSFTLIGGMDGFTCAHGIAIGPRGDVFVTGVTEATGLAVPAGGPDLHDLAPGVAHFADAFVARFDPALGEKWFTYVGGSKDENVSNHQEDPYGIAVDREGNAWITGETFSSDFDVTSDGVAHAAGGPGAYVLELNHSGTGIEFSTLLTNSQGRGRGIAFDPSKDVYVCGTTSGGTLKSFLTLFEPGGPETESAFVTKLGLNKQGHYITLRSTYFGGRCAADLATKLPEGAAGIAVDRFHTAYITGTTPCKDYPVVNPAQPTFHGDNDAFVAKIFMPTVSKQLGPLIKAGPPAKVR